MRKLKFFSQSEFPTLSQSTCALMPIMLIVLFTMASTQHLCSIEMCGYWLYKGMPCRILFILHVHVHSHWNFYRFFHCTNTMFRQSGVCQVITIMPPIVMHGVCSVHAPPSVRTYTLGYGQTIRCVPGGCHVMHGVCLAYHSLCELTLSYVQTMVYAQWSPCQLTGSCMVYTWHTTDCVNGTCVPLVILNVHGIFWQNHLDHDGYMQ